MLRLMELNLFKMTAWGSLDSQIFNFNFEANLEFSEGIEIKEMNLTQNFERARHAAEKNKNAAVLNEQSVNRLVEIPARGKKSVEFDRESLVDESGDEADVTGSEVLNNRVVPFKEAAVNINNDQVVN